MLGLRINMALLCDVCERPLPDDDTKIDIALCGVVRPCPGCKQQLSEEDWEALAKEAQDAQSTGA